MLQWFRIDSLLLVDIFSVHIFLRFSLPSTRNKVNLSPLISSHSWDLGLTGGDPGLFPQESTHVHNMHGYPR